MQSTPFIQNPVRRSGPHHRSLKVLVLGLGNDLLTDDAIGLHLVRAAGAHLHENKNIQVTESLEMGLSLLDLLTGFDAALIVDSIQTGKAPPGFLHNFDLTELEQLPSWSPHFAGIGEVIALGRKLDLPVPGRVRILAVEVDNPFTVSDQISAALRAKVPDLVDQVVRQAKTLASSEEKILLK